MSEHDPLNPDVDYQNATEREEAVRLKALSEADDVVWLMGSKRGRRILWRILESAGVFKTSFSTDALLMAFSEGTRNEGLKILSAIHTHCPEKYHLMAKEGTYDNRNTYHQRSN